MIAPGQLIGDKYSLLHEVGHGGMASVWEAEHVTLGSSVAVKFIVTGTRDAGGLADRFLQEARAAAGIRHRNVVEILDFGRGEHGRPFMVMEFLRGRSLADAIHSESPPSVVDTLRWVGEALSGLAAVHDEGLIHRDLKPANIFIASDADGEFAKIVDFGLSRTMGEMHPDGDAMLAGTPEYMSPEQARMSTDLDKRTDIYSVGVILYQLLTGALPFADEDLGSLLSSIQRAQPFALSMSPGVGEAMVSVVEKAMARDRSQRFDSAREMRQALLAAIPSVEPVVRTIVGGPILSRSSHALTLEGTLDAAVVPVLSEALTVDQPVGSLEAETEVDLESPRKRVWIAAGVALVLGTAGLVWLSAPDPSASPSDTASRASPSVDEVSVAVSELSERESVEAEPFVEPIADPHTKANAEGIGGEIAQESPLLSSRRRARSAMNEAEPEAETEAEVEDPDFERDIGF